MRTEETPTSIPAELEKALRVDVRVLGVRREAEDGSIHVLGPGANAPLDREGELIVEGPTESVAQLRALIS